MKLSERYSSKIFVNVISSTFSLLYACKISAILFAISTLSAYSVVITASSINTISL